jgi:hypothetical protein
MGKSGRAILEALCAGESDPVHLAQRMHPSVHASQEQVVAALTADMREHHRFLLRELLSLIDAASVCRSSMWNRRLSNGCPLLRNRSSAVSRSRE